MVRSTETARPDDYSWCVSRFMETCRQNQWDVVEAIAHERGLRQYAEAVREECALQAAKWGADAHAIRQLDSPTRRTRGAERCLLEE
jgi:hypothetical protein